MEGNKLKRLKVTVNGRSYEVLVEEVEENKNDKLVKDNTLYESGNNNIKKNEEIIEKESSEKDEKYKSDDNLCEGEPIKAPMPGTVISVNVNVGQRISKGNVLLVLEAMKMENEITAPRDCEVCMVNVKKGDCVDSGDNLVFLK